MRSLNVLLVCALLAVPAAWASPIKDDQFASRALDTSSAADQKLDTAIETKKSAREDKSLKFDKVEKETHSKAEASSKDVATNDREGKSAKYPQQAYAAPQHYAAPAAPQSYAPSHIPTPVYSNPNEDAIGFVYYYLPQIAEKKYPKIKDYMPYIRRYSPYFLPVMRRVATEVWSVGTIVGLTLGAIGALATLPAITGAFIGRKRRDLNEVQAIQDIDKETFVELSRNVDRVLETYLRAFQKETCLEKFSCEAGELTARVGSFIANPLFALLEPLVPEYMQNKFLAFKHGLKSRSVKECNASYKCSVPSFFR